MSCPIVTVVNRRIKYVISIFFQYFHHLLSFHTKQIHQIVSFKKPTSPGVSRKGLIIMVCPTWNMIDDHHVTKTFTKSQRRQLKYVWNFQPESLGKMMNPFFDYFKMGWFNHQPPRHSPQNITYIYGS